MRPPNPEDMGQSPWDVLSGMFEEAPAAAPNPAGADAGPPGNTPVPSPSPPPPQGMAPVPGGPEAPPSAPPAPGVAPGVADGAQANPDGLEPIIAKVLMERAKTLSPQESQAFFAGTTVPALLVLKKMLPEIAPAIDDSIQRKQGGGQPGAPAGAGPQMPPPPQVAPPQAAPPRPPSGLRQF
jgi:hypothetical protein